MRFWPVIFISSWIVLEANAQHENWSWRTFKMNDGLAFPSATCITEDENGYMWIGTGHGLSRFDGTHFINFYHLEGDSTSLPSNYVIKIHLAHDGNILIGTDYGFSVFNIKTGKFRNTKFNFESINSADQNLIRGFCEWPDGHTWIATFAGTIDWDEKANTFKMLPDGYDCSRNGFGTPFIMDPDSAGCWIATPMGMVHYDRLSDSLTPILSKFQHATYDNNDRWIESYTRDLNGNIWYTVLKDSALYCYSPKDKTEKKIQRTYMSNGREEPISHSGIMCDSNNFIWFGTWHDTPSVFNPITEEFNHIKVNENDPYVLPYPLLDAFFQSKNGNMWLAHRLGFSVHSKSMEAVVKHQFLEKFNDENFYNNNILSLSNDLGTQNYYVGTAGGMLFYDRSLNKFSHFDVSMSDELANEIIEMHWIDQELWCGTRNGLYIFNPQLQSFRKWNRMDLEFESTGIYKIFEDHDDIWISCRNAKLYRFNKLSEKWKKYEHIEGDSTSLSPYNYPYLLTDNSGTLWLANHFGYSWFDKATDSFHHGIAFKGKSEYGNTNVSGFLLDREGMIWYTLNGVGMYRIDPSTKLVSKIEGRDVSGAARNFALCEDEHGLIWFGAISGIHSYDPKTQKFRDYKMEQNISSGKLHSKGVSLGGDILLLAGELEILELDLTISPEQLTVLPPLVSYIVSGDSVIINIGNSIQLDADNNYFSFYFSSPTASERVSLEYQYKLAGVDKEWVSADKRTMATYNNLSGGDYSIQLRVRSGASDWIEMKSPIKIIIEKGFFETNLFRMLIVLAVAGILTIIVLWRKRIEHRLDQQRTLKHFMDVQRTQSVDEIARLIADDSVNLLRFGQCAVYLLQDDGNFHLTSQAQNPGIRSPRIFQQQYSFDHLNSEKVQNQGELSFKSERIDLIHESVIIGFVLASEHNNNRSFVNDRAALESISAIASDKIANARANNEMKEKERMLSQINALLSESQLVSLRAQMNPHFVFNCLNSIQESIVMKQYAEASLYLNKFSRLFRMVLQNSSRNLISLTEEMNVLRLYLELEHMRFQQSFEYTIICDDKLDTDETMIPSMLLQPVVENALWHGLMHKEGNRNLTVRFYLQDEDIFICEIEDNGIGRQKAAEIKKQKSQTQTHESKGISISRDRLNLINLKQGKFASMEFVDLQDSNDHAIGTKVIFKISAYLN